MVTGMLRALNGVTDGTSLPGATGGLGQNPYFAPTVFNYYMPDSKVPGTSILGPEFGIHTTVTAVGRANLVYRLVYGGYAGDPNIPMATGTRVFLAPFEAIADDPAAMVSLVNQFLTGGRFPAALEPTIVTAVNAIALSSPPTATQRTDRARMAVSPDGFVLRLPGAALMNTNRRKFLTSTSALTASALAGNLGSLGCRKRQRAASPGYKAIVCVFLFGGSDSNNMIVPFTDYGEYSAVRTPASNVGLSQAQLVPFSAPSHGKVFGFHPSRCRRLTCSSRPVHRRQARGDRELRHADQADDQGAIQQPRMPSAEPVFALGPAGPVQRSADGRARAHRMGRSHVGPAGRRKCGRADPGRRLGFGLAALHGGGDYRAAGHSAERRRDGVRTGHGRRIGRPLNALLSLVAASKGPEAIRSWVAAPA